MAPTQCCQTCPRKLSSSLGLYHHREACNEYQKYMAAHQTLHQQVTDTQLRSKIPKTSHSPGPQHELEAMWVDDIVSTLFIMGLAENSYKNRHRLPLRLVTSEAMSCQCQWSSLRLRWSHLTLPGHRKHISVHWPLCPGPRCHLGLHPSHHLHPHLQVSRDVHCKSATCLHNIRTYTLNHPILLLHSSYHFQRPLSKLSHA